MMSEGELGAIQPGMKASGGPETGSSTDMLERAVAENEMKEHIMAEALVRKVRAAWKFDDDYEVEYRRLVRQSAFWSFYLPLSTFCRWLVKRNSFHSVLIVAIVAAAILVGIQTEVDKPGHVKPQPALEALEKVILSIFTVDILAKIVAKGEYPLTFFDDQWNTFDFVIVFACYVFLLPNMPRFGSALQMLRLLRLLRILKLVRVLPELGIIIEALISGFSSISFVTIILSIFFYLYAIVGIMLFQKVSVVRAVARTTPVTDLIQYNYPV